MTDEAVDRDHVVPLFARRLARLEQVNVQIRHLLLDQTQCTLAEMQSKADQYLNGGGNSHGERDALARHNSVSLSTETTLLKGQIEALREEQSFLRFVIEWDAGE